jgi:hypothetical protein
MLNAGLAMKLLHHAQSNCTKYLLIHVVFILKKRELVIKFNVYVVIEIFFVSLNFRNEDLDVGIQFLFDAV